MTDTFDLAAMIADREAGTLKDTLGRRNRKLAPIQCGHCGATFLPDRSSRRFCSRKCGTANNGGQNRKSEMWRKPNKRGYIDGTVFDEDGVQHYAKQHRWMMEQHLGRKLLPTEDVHHINGVKHDNRLENLQVIDHGEHTRHHNLNRQTKRTYTLSPEAREQRIASCRKMLERKRELGLCK